MSSQFLNNNINNFISGLSVLFFSFLVFGVEWTYLPPQLTKYLNNNDIPRQIFIFIVILISIQFIDNDSSQKIEDKILGATLLYLFSLLFTKQTLLYSLFEIMIFISLYFLFYYLTTYKPTGQEKENIHIAMYVMTGLLLATVILGSQQYYLKQRKDKGNRFSNLKFLFGNPEKERRIKSIRYQR